jgi:hypothetical protein
MQRSKPLQKAKSAKKSRAKRVGSQPKGDCANKNAEASR